MTVYEDYLVIIFHSDGSVQDSGFLINYVVLDQLAQTTTAVPCELRTTDGTITSTNYPRYYENNEDWCVTLEGEAIELTFGSHMNIQCPDSLELTINDITTSYCWITVPVVDELYEGPITIRFQSDGQGTSYGFHLQYNLNVPPPTPPPCDVRYTSGVISEVYYGREDWCVIIDAETVQLTFSSVHSVEFSINCTLDYLSLTLNGTERRYCGRDQPWNDNVYIGPVIVRFHSNSHNADGTTGRFRIDYNVNVPMAVPWRCDEDVRTNNGTLQTTSYPGRYASNDDWCIQLYSEKVRLILTMNFNVELTPGCNGDYLSIRFNNTENRYCGSTLPFYDQLYEGPVEVRFHSNRANTGYGFQLQYLLYDSEPLSCEVHSGDGSVQTSNFPDHYGALEEWCVVLQGEDIRLQFDPRFSLELSPDCSRDYVAITVNQETYRFCGQYESLDPILEDLYDGPIMVHFYSDSRNSDVGFRLRYQFNVPSPTLPECEYSTTNNTISTTNFPDAYDNNEDWCLTIEAQNTHLTILHWDILPSTNCTLDYLSLTNDGTTIRYCGNDRPLDSVMYVGQVHLRFHSNSRDTSSGFQIEYAVNICEVGDASGIIQSSNYPESYSSTDEWCIQLNGRYLKLSLEGSFHLPDTPQCTAGHLDITTNGVTSRYCGDTPPDSGYYEGPMFVEFYGIQPGYKGFSFSYHVIDEIPTPEDVNCRRRYGEGSITTTDDDREMYSSNIDWCYTFRMSVGLKFSESFDLEFSDGCDFDFVSISYAGTTTRYCGTNAPDTMIYDGPVTVRFHSDGQGVRGGFHMYYNSYDLPESSTLAPCEQRGRQGMLKTDNHPLQYNNNEDWCIIFDSDRIELVFLAFQLEPSAECGTSDYVSLTVNGLTTKYCGDVAPASIQYDGPVILRFHSDVALTGRGFKMEYRESSESSIPCGFTDEGEQEGTQWPWQAQIYHSGIYIGEGVILSPRWILTAASVTLDMNEKRLQPSDLAAVVGDYNTEYVGTEIKHNVDTITRHKDYTSEYNEVSENNIALLRLQHTISFNDFTRPICLTRRDMEIGSQCRSWTFINDPNIQVSSPINITIITKENCGRIFSNYGEITARHICGHPTFVQRTCNENFGVPLICADGDRLYLQGVSSWFREPCNLYPTVYTHTSHYLDWIMQHIPEGDDEPLLT